MRVMVAPETYAELERLRDPHEEQWQSALLRRIIREWLEQHRKIPRHRESDAISGSLLHDRDESRGPASRSKPSPERGRK